MHCIEVMTLQTACRALEPELLWLQQCPDKPKEQGDTEMMTTEMSRPHVPRSVMSPNPVVVSAVTVKYSASMLFLISGLFQCCVS